MCWDIVDSGRRSAEENMALDAALLADLETHTHPILHIYDWEGDAATYGHFIHPENLLNMEGVLKQGLQLAKRPTGGGIVFHNCDLAFSVLVPATSPHFSRNTLDNYAFVNRHVMWVVEQYLARAPAELLPEEPEPMDVFCQSFCMAKPTKYDVMIQGRKVGGAAQRKTRHGFLHQGSISLGLHPESYLNEILLPETRVLEGMRRHTFPLLGESWTKEDLETSRQRLRTLLKQAFILRQA